MSAFPRPHRRIAGSCAAGVLLLLLSSCASSSIVHDYRVFSDSYARDMNWQLLLNLARLHQGHPAHFVAIGDLKLNRTHGASLNLDRTSSATITELTSTTATAVTSNRTLMQVATRLWKPGATTSVTPQMQFIPMNSEETAKQLLAPVPAKVLAMLVDQGYRVDHIVRLLVERIDDSGRVLVNRPTTDTDSSYGAFLEKCAQLRTAQTQGRLKVSVLQQYNPVEGAPALTLKPSTVALKDINDSAERGMFWKSSDGKNGPWTLQTRREVLELEMIQETKSKLPTTTFRIYSEPGIPAPRSQQSGTDKGAVMTIRSYRRMLEAIADEQRLWSPDLQQQLASFDQQEMLRPILRFTATPEVAADPAKGSPTAVEPTVALRYVGQDYRVTDPAPNERWNRDVFRLVSQLASQVTIDISKYQRTMLHVSP